mmetsp:Transcript_24140/g.34783  ORF Transcript_24140/g.34783 Transcript_24140/m.34783 type:complete len:80 (+) Transcript_24140:264-503(+)
MILGWDAILRTYGTTPTILVYRSNPIGLIKLSGATGSGSIFRAAQSVIFLWCQQHAGDLTPRAPQFTSGALFGMLFSGI